jgi:dynein heavy chain
LEVKPKQMALDAANEELSRAQQAFSKILARVQILEDCLTEENLKMQRALAEKDDAVRTKERLARQIDLAERLVHGLASSRIIWTKRVETFKSDLETLVGDVLLASTFISYAGYFSRTYRVTLVNKWKSAIGATKVSVNRYMTITLLCHAHEPRDSEISSSEDCRCRRIAVLQVVLMKARCGVVFFGKGRQ